MERKEFIPTNTLAVTDIVCNCCGNSCKTREHVVDNPTYKNHGEKVFVFEYMKLEAHWGFDSKKDCEQWTAHVCEKCVEEKLMPLIKFEIELKSPFDK